MKKPLGVLIGAALASAVAATANAYTVPVGSNITGAQLWYDHYELLTWEAPGYFHDLAFGGTATDANNDGFVDSANLTFTGELGFTVAGIVLRIDFDLNHGTFQQGHGINFTGGQVQIDYQTTNGWWPYSTIDVHSSNLPFLAGYPGQLASEYPNQITAGVVRNQLPGLWDGNIGSAGFNRGVAALFLLGQPMSLYLQGSITPLTLDGPALNFGPPEIPVPAAAWLFGSGLAGLAGARGLRRRSG